MTDTAAILLRHTSGDIRTAVADAVLDDHARARTQLETSPQRGGDLPARNVIEWAATTNNIDAVNTAAAHEQRSSVRKALGRAQRRLNKTRGRPVNTFTQRSFDDNLNALDSSRCNLDDALSWARTLDTRHKRGIYLKLAEAGNPTTCAPKRQTQHAAAVADIISEPDIGVSVDEYLAAAGATNTTFHNRQAHIIDNVVTHIANPRRNEHTERALLEVARSIEHDNLIGHWMRATGGVHDNNARWVRDHLSRQTWFKRPNLTRSWVYIAALCDTTLDTADATAVIKRNNPVTLLIGRHCATALRYAGNLAVVDAIVAAVGGDLIGTHQHDNVDALGDALWRLRGTGDPDILRRCAGFLTPNTWCELVTRLHGDNNLDVQQLVASTAGSQLDGIGTHAARTGNRTVINLIAGGHPHVTANLLDGCYTDSFTRELVNWWANQLGAHPSRWQMLTHLGPQWAGSGTELAAVICKLDSSSHT